MKSVQAAAEAAAAACSKWQPNSEGVPYAGKERALGFRKKLAGVEEAGHPALQAVARPAAALFESVK